MDKTEHTHHIDWQLRILLSTVYEHKGGNGFL